MFVRSGPALEVSHDDDDYYYYCCCPLVLVKRRPIIIVVVFLVCYADKFKSLIALGPNKNLRQI